jgi:hypothetical protein
MYFWLLFSLSCVSTLTFCSPNPHDRYNPYRKKPHIPVTQPLQETDQAEPSKDVTSSEPLITELENGSDPLSIDDTSYLKYKTAQENDITQHTPLGAICLEIEEYCSYFIQNCMNDDSFKQQRQSLTLFCNVLELLANLADGDCGIIRLHHYLLNLSMLSKTLYTSSSSDSDIINHQTDYPFILQMQKMVHSEEEITFFMNYTLRSPAAGAQTITALFNELKTYAHYKLHAVLETFQQDTHALLRRTQHPELENREEFSSAGFQRTHIHWLGWLCKHAATTCLDLVQTLPSSPLLAHTSSLMNQIQLMLSTMALTYTNLGANTVRSQDRTTLATHYAHLISHMDASTPRRGALSYLSTTQALPTFEEKQDYLENIFASEYSSTQLLKEFFPAFNDMLDHNLTQFCKLLTQQVLNILETRYWMQ